MEKILMKKTRKNLIAKAMGDLLESLDWNVYYRSINCPSCNNRFTTDDKFCRKCGIELPINNNETLWIDDLYAAFMAGKRAEKKYNNGKKK